MTDDSDDGDYRFSPDDFGEDGSLLDGEEDDSSGSLSSAGDTFSYEMMVLFPISLVAVYTFFYKSVAIAAFTSMFGGASTLATVLGMAFYMVGAISVAGVTLVLVAVLFSLLLALVKRSGTHLALFIMGATFYGGAYLLAVSHFTMVPLVVGFFLATFTIGWGIALLLGALAVLGGLALI